MNPVNSSKSNLRKSEAFKRLKWIKPKNIKQLISTKKYDATNMIFVGRLRIKLFNPLMIIN